LSSLLFLQGRERRVQQVGRQGGREGEGEGEGEGEEEEGK
jgi:hypothetical protein